MNDASSDSTNWVVKAHGHTLVSHVFNLGYGSALQLGYKYAIRRKYSYVIQMDADGQHDVCNITGDLSETKTAGCGRTLPGYRALFAFYGGKCRVSGLRYEETGIRILPLDDKRSVPDERLPIRRPVCRDLTAGHFYITRV